MLNPKNHLKYIIWLALLFIVPFCFYLSTSFVLLNMSDNVEDLCFSEILTPLSNNELIDNLKVDHFYLHFSGDGSVKELTCRLIKPTSNSVVLYDLKYDDFFKVYIFSKSRINDLYFYSEDNLQLNVTDLINAINTINFTDVLKENNDGGFSLACDTRKRNLTIENSIQANDYFYIKDKHIEKTIYNSTYSNVFLLDLFNNKRKVKTYFFSLSLFNRESKAFSFS
ncbi:hypothetical protein H1S01_15745 [Heliobacterium chlorum]|uniref:Uncharacterized protein n=1 Tax=Heliobacterium chlorum TaxID=2698 RepID=A0ABR7T575_HELCL|nr:hypothetical protein [Heliobacterium chlorum]MBC9785938.1 hypothetical protein [Heliobacterium chlorum]